MTRAHFKFAKAWALLRATLGAQAPVSLARWMGVRWGVEALQDLTPQQARAGARQLHAWRGSLTHGAPMNAYPRQWRRNARNRARWEARQRAAA